jgi:glycosyltransferase involved in cell wall biosynthesis
MKVLYLSTDPGIDLTGQCGGSIHIRSFVRSLADLGHEVAVVCSSVSNGRRVERKLRAMVRPAPLASWNRSLARCIRGGNSLLGRAVREHPDLVRILHNFTFARIASAVARDTAPDFVYERSSLWGWPGVRLARAHAIPHVLEVNAPLAREQQRYRGLTFPALARAVERLVWRRADLVIGVSEPLRPYLQGAGVRAEDIRILPNGVDTSLFRSDVPREPARRRLNLEGRFVIGFAGSLKPWHGVDWLLAAFEQLRQTDSTAHALIVGDGPLRQSLEEQASNRGLRGTVTFTGAVDHEAMPDYLAAMDVAVAPYPALDDFYYSPLKLFEYMAAGRAVVASRVGQVAQILADGETGLLCEPGNSASLVYCIRRLRSDAALRQELGRRAREASVAHTWSHTAEQVVSWVIDLNRCKLSRVAA